MAENNNNRSQDNQAGQDPKKGDQKPAQPQQRQQGTQGGQGQPVGRDREMEVPERMRQGNRNQGLDEGKEIGKDIGAEDDVDTEDLGDEEVEPEDEDSRVTQRNPAQGRDPDRGMGE